eukprot:3237603-Alexandrium_andersonii.AAC.1
MSASLVGSEMCIRDRCKKALDSAGRHWTPLRAVWGSQALGIWRHSTPTTCLLYTSDAADDM